MGTTILRAMVIRCMKDDDEWTKKTNFALLVYSFQFKVGAFSLLFGSSLNDFQWQQVSEIYIATRRKGKVGGVSVVFPNGGGSLRGARVIFFQSKKKKKKSTTSKTCGYAMKEKEEGGIFFFF